MTARWALDTVPEGREVARATLGPRARIAAPGPCSVVTLLSGDADIGDRTLGPGDCAAVAGHEIVAGPGGCVLGAVRWSDAPPSGDVAIESTASRHIEKYQSFQAQLNVRAGDRDLLAPWELYRVRMVAEAQSTVQLHVHHVVTNPLFVTGPPGSARGSLVPSRDGRVTATPLVGGDRVVVRPGVHHHVVPLSSGDPTDMVVFNDGPSAYEHVDRSDFHLVCAAPWSDVVRTPRPAPGPCLTVAG